VYVVENTVLERRYALKVLHGQVVTRATATVDRFVREARAAARLHHPNIVDVFDFGYLDDGRPYFVMELLDGQSVTQLVESGPVPVEHAVAIAIELGDALAAAHESGVIHADVSSGNVLVSRGEPLHVKLLDFGLAELKETRADAQPPADEIHGTPRYIAPEMIRGLPASEHADQYAFGALLFEMLAGEAPFLGPTVHDTCVMHLQDPVPELHDTVPHDLVAIVKRCLAKQPAARYPSMRAVVAELPGVLRRAGRQGWRRWLP
jgi:serine/threonine-protein kinase